jgi:hypothetical protein
MAFLSKTLHLQTFYKAFSIGVCVCVFFQDASDSKFEYQVSQVPLLRSLQGRLPRKPVIGGSGQKSARSKKELKPTPITLKYLKIHQNAPL